MKSRKPAQKVSFVSALICYAMAILTLLAAGYLAIFSGTESPVFASLLASTVFFIGSGIVLHVMGVANLPDLKIK